MKRRVVAYIRVSTEEQATHGYSIETQRQLLADYAAGHDLDVVRTFEESHSAHKPGRPEFSAMLKFLRKRKDVTGVLCYKLDRLSRNLQDYSVLEEMEGMSIISVTESLPEGASGRFVASIHAAVSRLYSDQLGERVRHAANTKVRRGGWPGPAPTGYVNDREAKVLLPDPEMAPIVRRVFEVYANEDISLSQLVGRAKSLGLRTRSGGVLSKGPLHKLLGNPIYCGLLRYEGKVYQGEHEPIVSKALYNRAQDKLRGRSHPLTKRRFPYRGLMTCGYCGCRITASLIKGKYVYYHCTHGKGKCGQSYLPQDSLGELFFPVVEAVRLSEEQVRALMAGIRREGGRRKRDAESRMRELRRQLTEVTQMRDKAYEDKLRGVISDERWSTLESNWSAKEDRLSAQMVDLELGTGPAEDEALATFELLERAPRLYRTQPHEERVRLLKALLSNSILMGKNLDPFYRKPFDLVAEGVSRSLWLPGEDSNLQPTG